MAANSTQPSPMAPNRAQDTGKGDSAVGTYKKMEEIGRGSFATVYKAIYLVSIPIHGLAPLPDCPSEETDESCCTCLWL